jgi:uncharacterized membrane protein YkoI
MKRRQRRRQRPRRNPLKMMMKTTMKMKTKKTMMKMMKTKRLPRRSKAKSEDDELDEDEEDAKPKKKVGTVKFVQTLICEHPNYPVSKVLEKCNKAGFGDVSDATIKSQYYSVHAVLKTLVELEKIPAYKRG